MTSTKEETIVLRRSNRQRAAPKLQQLNHSSNTSCNACIKKFRKRKPSAATAKYTKEGKIKKLQCNCNITKNTTDNDVDQQVFYSQFPELPNFNFDIEELNSIMPFEMASFIESSNFDSTNFISTELASTNSSIHTTSSSNTSFPNSSMSYASNTSDEVLTLNDIGVLDLSFNKKRILDPESVLTPPLVDLAVNKMRPSSNTSFENSSMSLARNTSDEAFTLSDIDVLDLTSNKKRLLVPELVLTPPSVNKMRPTYSAFGRNTHSIGVMQNKENWQVQFATAASSQAQEPTEESSIKKSVPMRTRLTTESAATGIYTANAQPTTHLGNDKGAISILQKIFNPQGIQPTYEFLHMNNGLSKCIVCTDHHDAIGTGDSQNEAQRSAATSLIDQLSNGKFFGNPIGNLHELCIRFRWKQPIFEEVIRLPNDSHFTTVCKVNCSQGNIITTEQGKSKKSSKRLAALKMLIKIKETFST